MTAIDTANQPRHYQEPLVGAALLALGKKVSPEIHYFSRRNSPLPMKEDLQAHHFELTTDDAEVIDSIGNR
ncbi:MAG: hypothetical protein PVH61_10155 [Candidatus Aminicenantes bacterium]|jgi:hypothetical protein